MIAQEKVQNIKGRTEPRTDYLKPEIRAAMADGSIYGDDYYLRGKQTGLSLYENFRWLPELTIPMCSRIVGHLGIEPKDSILDFGCALGYPVKAFRLLGYNAWGFDISEWALSHADEGTKPYLISDESTLWDQGFDWLIAKDTLEHVPQVADVALNLITMARKGVFVVVPLSEEDGGLYSVPSYEEDITHIHRLTLASWAKIFMRPKWSVTASYRMEGIKDNYADFEKGNGFFIIRRL